MRDALAAHEPRERPGGFNVHGVFSRRTPLPFMPYELLVGLRYLRARRRNRFISINSAVSMIGIAVGVWALIVVLSVMNGFQKEVRTRILGVVSHVQISGVGNRLSNWQQIVKMAEQKPHVVGAAPFVQAQ